MVSDTAYALMSGAAYFSNRAEGNRFPIPSNWDELEQWRENYDSSGFEARTFQSGNEIVISYAGTDPTDPNDMLANTGLGAGTGSVQLTQAADYYLKVKAAAPAGTKITLTGHSLGGGLAALVGVFFGVEAHTFDQAPFKQSAIWTANDYNVATALQQHLINKAGLTANESEVRDELLARLNIFINRRNANGPNGDIPNANLVSNINVTGEFLTGVPWNALNRIGATIQNLAPGPNSLSGFQLHSQALLAAFKLNDGFREVTYPLTDLLAMVFDTSLFARDTGPLSTERNLLEHLLRHQVGVREGTAQVTADAMLDRFTADLQLLAETDGMTGSGKLTDALIAFAMQAYYGGARMSEATRQFFAAEGGGLQFRMSDTGGNVAQAKGHHRYFIDFLATLPQADQDAIGARLTDFDDWYIAGARLTAEADATAAFMLGAAQTDQLVGGSQDDLLVGLGGDDTLEGRGGNDRLVGGEGVDTYRFRLGDGDDTIIDSDKRGRLLLTSADGDVFYNLSQFIRDRDDPTRYRSADGKATLTTGSGWQLQIDGGGRIELGNGLQDGDLGIHLKNATDAIDPVNTEIGDGNDDKDDYLGGDSGSDLLDARTGDDRCYGYAGDDKLLCGEGDDYGDGGLDDDLIVETANCPTGRSACRRIAFVVCTSHTKNDTIQNPSVCRPARIDNESARPIELGAGRTATNDAYWRKTA